MRGQRRDEGYLKYPRPFPTSRSLSSPSLAAMTEVRYILGRHKVVRTRDCEHEGPGRGAAMTRNERGPARAGDAEDAAVGVEGRKK